MNKVNRQIKKEIARFNRIQDYYEKEYNDKNVKLSYNSRHFVSIKKKLRKFSKLFPDMYFYLSRDASDEPRTVGACIYPYSYKKDCPWALNFWFYNMKEFKGIYGMVGCIWEWNAEENKCGNLKEFYAYPDISYKELLKAINDFMEKTKNLNS